MAITRDQHHAGELITDRLASVVMIKGAVAGMAAGAMMAMFSMLANMFTGDGFWAPPRAITATFFGAEHAGTAFAGGSVLVGMMIHMLLSAMFGVAFFAGVTTALVRRSTRAYLAAGMAWGMLLWTINTYLAASLMAEPDALTDAMPALTWIGAHLMFGAALGLSYAAWPARRDGERGA